MDHEHAHEAHNNYGIKEHYTVRDFLPLIIIFAVIIAITAGAIGVRGEWDILFAMRIFEGAFFIIFGAFKLFNLRGFADAYSTYDIIAKRIIAYGYLYPFLELGLGVAYLAGANLLLTAWVTLVLMLVSAVGVGNELRKKNRVPCACLGVVFKVPMTWVTLAEDLLMAGMALGMIVMLS